VLCFLVSVIKQAFVQPSTVARNVTLLPFAADRRAAVRRAAAAPAVQQIKPSIDRPAGRTAANPPHSAAAIYSWD